MCLTLTTFVTTATVLYCSVIIWKTYIVKKLVLQTPTEGKNSLLAIYRGDFRVKCGKKCKKVESEKPVKSLPLRERSSDILTKSNFLS